MGTRICSLPRERTTTTTLAFFCNFPYALFAGIDEDGYFTPRSEGNNGLKISIVNVLKIPTIWFSFMAFIVATVCNGFLSINLEPKVG